MSLLLALVVVLLVIWLMGFFIVHVGSLIHFVLVVAVLVLIYDLLISRRRGRDE